MQPTNISEQDILTKIVDVKRRRLEITRQQLPLDELREQAFAVRATARPNRLSRRLAEGPGLNVIAEFKRRSPSKGIIRADVSVTATVREYELGGAAAISVLTEEDHFAGSLDDLRLVMDAVSLPVLRKDFIVDEYQVFESAVVGADAILLIVTALEDDRLLQLRRLAEEELSLDALVEVHTRTEMERALDCGARLIGVNNRDLKTFRVSLETSFALAEIAPAESLLVAESGLQSHEELKQLSKLGFDGFLIGETLMRAERPALALRALINGPETT